MAVSITWGVLLVGVLLVVRSLFFGGLKVPACWALVAGPAPLFYILLGSGYEPWCIFFWQLPYLHSYHSHKKT